MFPSPLLYFKSTYFPFSVFFIIVLQLASADSALTLPFWVALLSYRKPEWPELMLARTNCTVTVARLQTLIGALCENEPPNEALVWPYAPGAIPSEGSFVTVCAEWLQIWASLWRLLCNAATTNSLQPIAVSAKPSESPDIYYVLHIIKRSGLLHLS